MDVATARNPTCRSCAAALARCWVCGEPYRCIGCQQCLRCEGLLEDADPVRVTATLHAVPSVRLKRPKVVARPRPAPAPAPPPPARTKTRLVARRVGATPATPTPLADALWYVRAAVTPGLMLFAAYWCFWAFRPTSGLVLAAVCVIGYYLPYVAVTPVRRRGDFFPLGDDGPGLPVVMLVGAALVGAVCGVMAGVFGGERIGTWFGAGVAVLVFHGTYYATVREKAAALK